MTSSRVGRPSLGVLITYHNEGALLTECLDSLLAGSARPDEILIYDDASGDPAERYVLDRHPARILCGARNIGPGLARNALMKESQSEFIHFHDADDLFDPRWCSAVREAIGDGQTDLVLSNLLERDVRGTDRSLILRYDFNTLFPTNDLLGHFLAEYSSILVHIMTYRRSAAIQSGGFVSRDVLTFAEDFEFHVRLFAQEPKFRVLQEGLVIKRNRPDSLSCDRAVRLRPEAYQDGIKSLIMVKERLETRYHRHLPDILYRRGVGLFRSGRRREARRAFRIAAEWGGPQYRKQPEAYRRIAKAFGPEFAEWVVLFYSRFVPRQMREYLKRERLSPIGTNERAKREMC